MNNAKGFTCFAILVHHYFPERNGDASNAGNMSQPADDDDVSDLQPMDDNYLSGIIMMHHK